MTEKEINKDLDNELLSFYNMKYEGELFPNAIGLFKKAIFLSPPMAQQIHVSKIRSLLDKKEDELLFGEVGLIINCILSIPPEKLYKNINKYLESQEKIEKIFIAYNAAVNEEQKRLNRKRNSLVNLSGSRTRPLVKV